MASALMVDTKAHIEVTVKPELVYPENEDSCEVPAGECEFTFVGNCIIPIYRLSANGKIN